MQPRIICLVDALEFIQNASSRERLQKQQVNWIYLGKNVDLAGRVEALLEGKGTKHELGDRLQECAKEYRQSYIDYIGSLSSASGSLSWWLTSVSEKNPFITNVFLYFCYIKSTSVWIESFGGDLAIFCDDNVLLQAINTQITKDGYLTVTILGRDTRLSRKTITAPFFLSSKKIHFFIQYTGRIILARLFTLKKRTGRQNDAKKADRIALHSWIDHRSLSRPGDLNDIYFGNLRDQLGKSRPLLYVLDVLPTLAYISAWRFFWDSNRQPVVFLEEYLTLSDIIHALKHANFSGFLSKVYPDLAGTGINVLIRSELLENSNTTRAEQAYLRFCASRRLVQEYPISHYVYPFENHIWEKMVCCGVRSGNDRAILVGYAHTLINPMFTCYSVSGDEKSIMPAPDIIMVNGKKAKEVLETSGFDPDRIRIVGSLRYPDIRTTFTGKTPTKPQVILVVMSADYPKSRELYRKITAAFRDTHDLIINIKPHPTLINKKNSFSFHNLPPGFSLCDDDMQKILPSADLVLFSDSAAAVEALARRIPVLRIRSDFFIDLNIFDGYPTILSAGLPEDILHQARIILRNSAPHLADAGRIVYDLFAPVDTKVLEEIFQTGPPN